MTTVINMKPPAVRKPKGENLATKFSVSETFFKVKVEGLNSLLMRSPIVLCDPLHPKNKEIKALTSLKGKSKTEEVQAKIAALQWEYSLYLSDCGDVVVPTLWFKRSMEEGAKATRQGAQTVFAVRVVEPFVPLQHDGPANVKDLRTSLKNWYSVSVGIQDKRIPSVRPVFHNWSAEFTISVDPSAMNHMDVLGALCNAGVRKGVGDGRGGSYASIYGLYKVTEFVELAA